MKMEELMQAFDELCPVRYAESWDNPGLLVGRLDRDIFSVYIALDAGTKAVDEAVRQGCDLIITHHPLIFSAMKQVRDDDFIGRRIIDMIENKINYYAMHTNFDVAVMADLAAECLKLENVSPLEVTVTEDDIPKGIGCIGSLSETMSLRELARYVKDTFDLPQVRYYGDPEKQIHIAAMCPGSGKSCDAGAYAAGADVYITGDVDHHYGIDSVEKGLCIIDAGHHGIEHIYVDFMAAWFGIKFPEIRVVADQNDSPFQVI